MNTKQWLVQYAVCLSMGELTVKKNIDDDIALTIANMIVRSIEQPYVCVVDIINNAKLFGNR